MTSEKTNMTHQTDGERLAVLEEQSKELKVSVDKTNASIISLHTKFDGLASTLSEKYVSKDTFEEFKKTKLLERILTVLITSTVTGLVLDFIQGGFNK